jgi:hypothetical protein
MKGCINLIDLSIYEGGDEVNIGGAPATDRSWDANFCFPLGDYAFARAIFRLFDDNNARIDCELLYESTLTGSVCKPLCEELWEKVKAYGRPQINHCYRTLFFNVQARVIPMQVRVRRRRIIQEVAERDRQVFLDDPQRNGTIREVLQFITCLDETTSRAPGIVANS